MTRRYLALMIAPVSPSNGRTVEQNIDTAKQWYTFLREITADLSITIVCPWLLGILLGDDDSSPKQRERGIVDSETMASRCDFTIAVGVAPALTTGMQREHAACPGSCVNLLKCLPWMTEAIREQIRVAIRSLESPDNQQVIRSAREAVER